MTIVGYEFSEIQEAFKIAAGKIGRILQADSNPEVGAFYRNDAYPFSEAGIPASSPSGVRFLPSSKKRTKLSPNIQITVRINITNRPMNMTLRLGI